MTNITRQAFVSLGAMLLAGTAHAQTVPERPAPPPVEPVTETYFGTEITDDYRYMEDPENAFFQQWIRAEGAYARAVFDTPERNAVEKRISAITGAFTFANDYQRRGDTAFWLQRAPGEDNFDLMISDAGGIRKFIALDTLREAAGGTPMAINWYSVSPDGKRLAVGISEGGSEMASATMYDVATGKTIGTPLPLARIGGTGWSDDGETAYVGLLAEPDPEMKGSDLYLYVRSVAWNGVDDPVLLLGGREQAGTIKARPEQFLFAYGDGKHGRTLAVLRNGVQNELATWYAPKDAAITPVTDWQPLTTLDDGVTDLVVDGDTVYLMSHVDAPGFKVLSLELGQSVADAKTVLEAADGRVINSIAMAKDGLYVAAREGLYSTLYRIVPGGAAEKLEIGKVSISELSTEPDQDGAALLINTPAMAPTFVHYDPVAGKTVDMGLMPKPDIFDADDYVTREVSATAKDGTSIPLTLLEAKGVDGPRPLVIFAYGSYGISIYPGFSSSFIALVNEGFSASICHVRGGGEFGEEWRLGGKDENKPNTWRDLIACAEQAVAEGLTTPDQLFIRGGSAGGIPMGMAPTERPDLFAGVIDQVPMASALRSELQANGPANIPEFGTFKTEQGFKNLYAMDHYQHLERGKDYPAFLITTGLNDGRVDSWQPGKLAAKMKAYNPDNVVILRVNEEGGHGIGNTRAQTDAEQADRIAFMKWVMGDKSWLNLP